MSDDEAPAVPDPYAQQHHEDELEDNEGNKLIKKLVVHSAVMAVIHPQLTLKTLFQLGFEPYPLVHCRKFVYFGREAFFLPNAFIYGRYLARDFGLSVLYTGFESSVFAKVANTFVAAQMNKYLDEYYPNLGGAPENLGKGHSKLSHHEAFRAMFRHAIRTTIKNSIGIVVSRPFTVIAVRKIAQLVGGEAKYTTLPQCILCIGREEGPAGYFSGLIPAILSDAVRIWAVFGICFAVERAVIHVQRKKYFNDNQHTTKALKVVRRLTTFMAPYAVVRLSDPYSVVSTVMATVGSGLAVSMLPYSPTYELWQDAYEYLRPNGLKRGATLFFRQQQGAVSVGRNNLLYANNKHFA
ncbi:hypothetical protein QR680_001189 [Steinernema hermaphroditum]|uniref:Mitochondrial carrier protein n=1 Tax=Steinernema hermaphroditum TaxID=289476 RepID=A0AA39GX98_9BILA|nr:hypothetical protein QR680_001189 [Steinernema hermaphroditum]